MNLKHLKAEYRSAFAEYAAAVGDMQRLSHNGCNNRQTFAEAVGRVRVAEREYRNARDEYARALTVTTGVQTNIRSVAHSLWETAGKPAGSAESDWLRAERLVLAVCR